MELKERISTVYFRDNKETKIVDDQLKAFLADRAAQIWSNQSLFVLEHRILEASDVHQLGIFTEKRHTGRNSVIE